MSLSTRENTCSAATDGFPLQREIDYIVAVLLKQSARVEAHRLRPTLVEVVDVNKKDFHLGNK